MDQGADSPTGGGPELGQYIRQCGPSWCGKDGILGKNKWIPRFLFEISLWFQDRLLWSSEEGALTDLYLGLDTKALKENKIRGKYFHPQAVEVVNPYAEQVELQESVWTLCEQLVMQFI